VTEGGQPLRWRAAARLRGCAAVAVASILAAVLTRDAALLLLAGPALAALASASRAGRPASASPRLSVSTTRCFEGDEVTVTATVDRVGEDTLFTIHPDPGFTLAEGDPVQVTLGSASPSARWVLRPGTWGRHVPCTVAIRCRYGGIWQADLSVRADPLEIFPHPPPARATLVPPDLLRRIGEHTAASAGAGIEFAGIRLYQPGDRLRDLNATVTSRYGRPFINQRAALRAADLVLMIDTFSEVGPQGDTSLDAAVRSAAGLATAYLRTGDRVGLVILGGVLRWLGPAPGDRQFFRIVETAFNARFTSEVTPDLDRVPRTALPPRSLVVLFSPLLDKRAIGAVTDLRQRGVSLIVVDVLAHEPPSHPRVPVSSLAARLWRLDRRALHASLASLGVPVVRWDTRAGLDGMLAPLRGRPLPAVRS
jgi:uncharacterized protein (DUF58 family)